jgi:hypothetical protein
VKRQEDFMEAQVALDAIYVPSEDVVFRDIEGELIIVPLTSGIGDMEDAWGDGEGCAGTGDGTPQEENAG